MSQIPASKLANPYSLAASVPQSLSQPRGHNFARPFGRRTDGSAKKFSASNSFLRPFIISVVTAPPPRRAAACLILLTTRRPIAGGRRRADDAFYCAFMHPLDQRLPREGAKMTRRQTARGLVGHAGGSTTCMRSFVASLLRPSSSPSSGCAPRFECRGN